MPKHVQEGTRSGSYQEAFAKGKRMALIDDLAAGKHPGQVLPHFGFQGRISRTLLASDGTTKATRTENATIVIAAKNLWEAHVYLHTYLPNFEPLSASHRGDFWLARGTAVENPSS